MRHNYDMPRVVRAFERTARMFRRYPWDDWLDGRIRVFVRGFDFPCEPLSFVNAARSWSRKRGFTVRASMHGELVTLQALLEPRR